MEDVNTLAQQEAADRQAALALHQAQMRNVPMQANDPRVGRLSITITQVKFIHLIFLHNVFKSNKRKFHLSRISCIAC